VRTAKPNELSENAFPVMTATLSEGELTQWFPVAFQEISDPWAAPEPSKGALIKLDAGEYLVLDYGKDSKQLTVRIPAALDASACLVSLFSEVPLPRSRILWRRGDVQLPRHVATDEIRLAEEIVGTLDADAVRVSSDDSDSIRFITRSAGIKLRRIVLSRSALSRLLSNAVGTLVIKYLERELRRASNRMVEYVYPRRGAKTVVTRNKSLTSSRLRSRPTKER